MTGGVGFSKQAQDSFRNNRKLRKERISLKDNPYVAQQDGEAERDATIVRALGEWWSIKKQREKKLRLLIMGKVLPLIALAALLFALLV